MEERARITSHLIRAAMEASIGMSKSEEQPVCVVKFSLMVDFEDTFASKNALEYLYTLTQSSPLFHYDSNVFLLLLHHTKIHQAKTLLKHFKREVQLRFPHLLEAIGVTLVDKEDTYESLMERVDTFFLLSKCSVHKKICAGTKLHNPYTNSAQEVLLSKVFEEKPQCKLQNLYKGLPVVEKTSVVAYSEGRLLVQVEKKKLPFYQSETFTHLQHDLLASAIRASIAKVDLKSSLLVLTRIELLESSAFERNGVRIEPERKIFASALLGRKRVFEGELGALSEASVAIKTTQAAIQRFLHSGVSKEALLEVTFQLPTQKNLITTIKTQATVFNIVDEKIILLLHPSPLAKSKIRSYLSMQTEQIAKTFKQSLKTP